MKIINTHRKKRGFTLIEILVVVGIISILVSFVTVSFSAAQKKARDVKRRGDLLTLQKCMETYFAANQAYPTISTRLLDGAVLASCDSSNSIAVLDPINAAYGSPSVNYRYTYTENTPINTNYSVTANLEGSSTPFTVTNQQ